MPSKKQRSLKPHKQSTLRRSVRRKTPRSNHTKNRRKSKSNHKRQHALVRGGTTSQNILTASTVVAGTTLTAMMILAYRDHTHRTRTINYFIKLQKKDLTLILRFYCSYFLNDGYNTNKYDTQILDVLKIYNQYFMFTDKVSKFNTINLIYKELFNVTPNDKRVQIPAMMILRNILLQDTNSLENLVLFFITTCCFVVFDFFTFGFKKSVFPFEIITHWKQSILYRPEYKSDYRIIIKQFLENQENFKIKFKNDAITSIISEFCTRNDFKVQKLCVTQVVTGYQGNNGHTLNSDDDDDGGTDAATATSSAAAKAENVQWMDLLPEAPAEVPVIVRVEEAPLVVKSTPVVASIHR